MYTLNVKLNQFLGEDVDVKPENNNEKKVCDSKTGECYTITTKDGIIERVNKKYITEDGRLLLTE